MVESGAKYVLQGASSMLLRVYIPALRVAVPILSPVTTDTANDVAAKVSRRTPVGASLSLYLPTEPLYAEA